MNKIELAVNDLGKIRKNVFAVILYGSVARGDYSLRHSDIDVLIILDGSKKAVSDELLKISKKHRVKIHAEYQTIDVKDEDHTLMWKMFEEGRVLFSKGIVFMDRKNLGFEAYRLYRFDTSSISKVNRVMFSRALHGREGFKGSVDNISLIDSGRGGILARKDRFKDIESFFERFGVKYKTVKTFYG